MGWFDKNSWKRRSKLNDLRNELAVAEKQGRFLREDGLYFAELDDMGAATMVIFAGSDALASQEEDVIKGFFDRNGFTVDTLKVAPDGLTLDTVEIIPHDELIRGVGRALKNNGYRLVDDSEKEVPANLDENIVPLSALVRAITGLFARRAHYVIKQTRIKLNKEGNRLLHWMPAIASASLGKVQDEVIQLIAPEFDAAYAGLYGTTQQLPGLEPLGTAPPQKQPEPVVPQTEPQSPRQFTVQAKAENTASNVIPNNVNLFNAPASANPDAEKRAQSFTDLLSKLTKMLVRSTPNQCVSNSKQILAEINAFFSATASAVLRKPENADGLAIFAQAGKDLTWGGAAKSQASYPIAKSLLAECIQTRKPAIGGNDDGNDLTKSMVSNNIVSAMALPIMLNNNVCGILYIDRRGFAYSFNAGEVEMLQKIVKDIFQEFTDYTLGLLK